MQTNLFRNALALLVKKDNGSKLTSEEEKLLAAASIPLDILPEFSDMTTEEGLEDLARIMEGEEERKPEK